LSVCLSLPPSSTFFSHSYPSPPSTFSLIFLSLSTNKYTYELELTFYMSL
jgi:hypothetical protein